MKRLAILSTHPIQYNAPLFRMLHEDDGIELQVFFSKTWDQVKFDPDFQRKVVWDIPVSKGYPHANHDASSKAGKTSLATAIREFRPDALLVYGWNFPGHLAMMRIFHGKVPIWFRGDSHLLNPLPFWRRAIRRFALSWIYRHVDIAFPVGKANYKYYLWCGMHPIQLIQAPHAVDNQFWARDNNEREKKAKNLKNRLNIPTNAPVIGYSGKLEPLKQVGQLIEAAIKIHGAHILIAGSGPLEDELKNDYAQHSQIHFLGFVNQTEMPSFYRMIDVIALMSYSETWGLCINEAMACGAKCLVSDRVGCHLDILIDDKQGKVVPWNQPTTWINALSELLSTPKRTDYDVEQFKNTFHIKHYHQALLTMLNKLS